MTASQRCLGAFAIAIIFAASADAQSTSNVGRVERPFRVEASGGVDWARNGDYFGDNSLVRSAEVAVRWDKSGWGGIRGTVHGIQRDLHFRNPYSNSGSDSTRRQDRVIALTLSTDLSWRVWRDLTIAPSAGAGIAPYAHGESSTSRANPYTGENYSVTESGTIWTLGLALRYRWLVVEKHAIGLLGARNAVISGREYYPLTIGARF